MVYGIGADLLHEGTLPEGSLRPEAPFFQSTYTEAERREGASRGRPADYFRARFAGKEAVFKALRLHPDELRRWNQIEILSDSTGAPRVQLHDPLRTLALARGAGRIELSLSYDGGFYLAFCVVSAGARRQQQGAEHE